MCSLFAIYLLCFVSSANPVTITTKGICFYLEKNKNIEDVVSEEQH